MVQIIRRSLAFLLSAASIVSVVAAPASVDYMIAKSAEGVNAHRSVKPPPSPPKLTGSSSS
jgi:hypothetical protein